MSKLNQSNIILKSEDSFDAPGLNCLNNLDLPPLVILLLVLFCVLYLIVTAILENTEGKEPLYKL